MPLGKLGKLKKIPGRRRRARSAEDAIGSIAKLKERRSSEDERLSYIQRAVGSARLARQLYDLQEEYPAATVPELLCIHWLKRRNIRFLYQLNVRGGRVRQGGIVPDLVVLRDPYALVWMVNGNYWHNRPERRERDERSRVLLLGQRIEGREVIAVVTLWESKLLDSADTVCQAALMGIEMGQ